MRKMIFVLSFLYSLNLYSQIIPYREGDLWGYCDKNKNIVLTPRFEKVGLFNFGYAWFKENGKFGYIDEDLKIVIPAQFDEAQDFDFNYDYTNPKTFAYVLKGSDKFYINSKGEKVEPSYTVIEEPGQDIYTGQTIPYDKTKTTYDFVERLRDKDLYLVKLKNKWGVVNRNSEQIIPVVYDMISSDKSNYQLKGYTIERLIIKKDKYFGIFDLDGKQLINFKYKRISLIFDDTYAITTSSGKEGFININGIEYFKD
jgi:hypothetical protein